MKSVVPEGPWLRVAAAALTCAAALTGPATACGGSGDSPVPESDRDPVAQESRDNQRASTPEGIVGTPARLTLGPTAPLLDAPGAEIGLAARGWDREGRLVSLRSLRWATSRPDVASVDERGVVRAVRPGDARITVSVAGRSASVTVRVRFAGRVVVGSDGAALSDEGFEKASDARVFGRNLAEWLAGDSGSVLVYSTRPELTGRNLVETLRSAGYDLTVGTTPPTLESLRGHDALFVAGDSVDNDVLLSYVWEGGNVLLLAGTGIEHHVIEGRRWARFLDAFGINVALNYDMVEDVVPIRSDHVVLSGVEGLYHDDGMPVSVMDPDNPRTRVIARFDGFGLWAVYDPRAGTAAGVMEGGP